MKTMPLVVMKNLEKIVFSKLALAPGSKMEPSPLPLGHYLRQEKRLKVVFSCTTFLRFSSGLLVQISSPLIGNVLVNESSSVVDHLKLAIALACQAWKRLSSHSFNRKISCGLWPVYLEVNSTLPSRRKTGKSIQLHWCVPWAGAAFLVWKRLLSSLVFR